MRSIPFAVVLSCVLLAGCGDGSPTAPEPSPTPAANLTGSWFGDLGRRGIGNWTRSTIRLQQSGDELSGTLTNGKGRSWELRGEMGEPGALLGNLLVEGLPGSSTCSQIQLLFERFERDSAGTVAAVEGRLSGRCFGTVAGSFRLDRTS